MAAFAEAVYGFGSACVRFAGFFCGLCFRPRAACFNPRFLLGDFPSAFFFGVCRFFVDKKAAPCYNFKDM